MVKTRHHIEAVEPQSLSLGCLMTAEVLQHIHTLQRQSAALLVYQSVLDGEPGRAWVHLLDGLGRDRPEPTAVLRAYGHWFSSLATLTQSWQTYLLTQLLRSPNPFTQRAQRQEWLSLPVSLIEAAQHDLRILQSLYRCDGEQLATWVQAIANSPTPPVAWQDDCDGTPQASLSEIQKLPIWLKLEGIDDWANALPDLCAYYRQHGTGLFAEYRALRWRSGQLVGIAHPDPVRLTQLVGYEMQKQALLQNTEALLAGLPALHVLLYGSRGSGKSSLVKSLLHRYSDRGLRLVEVAKSDLAELVNIVDRLRDAPQRFIVFVDDLSFEEDDDAYKALKVVLEGNLTARPKNVVVYATSNRRHLIREFFGDRPRPSDADEIHNWDTVQEKLSFSDRFGLTLTFEPADQTTYLDIVRHLAAQFELDIDADHLEHEALQWATRHNGRSGRSAQHFIDHLLTSHQLKQRE